MEANVVQLKAARRAIGKKLRFEIFKRDAFTCGYCGLKYFCGICWKLIREG